MKWFTFSQNNSGGSFRIDQSAGIAHFVIVQAENVEDAAHRAEGFGVYFNGVANGCDCACCGDRWSMPWEDGSDMPQIYGQTVEAFMASKLFMRDCVAIHFADGDMHWVESPK